MAGTPPRTLVRGAFDAVGRVLANPRLLGRGLNKLYYRATVGECNVDGIDVFAADWDTLVILDACRYDLFESSAGLPGRLERRQSKASNTVGFLRANMADRDLRDSVYVTANPQFRKIEASLDSSFHAVVDLWDQGWNEAMNTVMPETVTDAAIEAAEEHPNKRLVVHYNQPHIPFIGSTGREWVDLDGATEHGLPFWQQPMAGDWEVDDAVIWEAYRENLELVLPHVERLLDAIPGKTVVTSDHGNMIGESSFPVPVREYGHPDGIYTPELVTVPWHVYTNGERREITTQEGEQTSERESSSDISDRLEALGYK